MEKLKLDELSHQELVNTYGGWGWVRTAIKYGRRFLEIVGAYEAAEEFKKGWDSVECGCEK